MLAAGQRYTSPVINRLDTQPHPVMTLSLLTNLRCNLLTGPRPYPAIDRDKRLEDKFRARLCLSDQSRNQLIETSGMDELNRQHRCWCRTDDSKQTEEDRLLWYGTDQRPIAAI